VLWEGTSTGALTYAAHDPARGTLLVHESHYTADAPAPAPNAWTQTGEDVSMTFAAARSPRPSAVAVDIRADGVSVSIASGGAPLLPCTVLWGGCAPAENT
jgi:hypothetical protein